MKTAKEWLNMIPSERIRAEIESRLRTEYNEAIGKECTTKQFHNNVLEAKTYSSMDVFLTSFRWTGEVYHWKALSELIVYIAEGTHIEKGYQKIADEMTIFMKHRTIDGHHAAHAEQELISRMVNYNRNIKLQRK